MWTGFDYRGEPSPNGWPNISSQYGIIDTCGFPKDTFYYYQSWWTSRQVLHLFPHWNWPGMEGKVIAVWVHSNLDKVELLLNGKSLGMKEMKKDSHLAWNVAYAPGTIEARGYKGDQQVMTAKRETTGSPAKLVVSADRQQIRADGEDVAMFAVEVQDAQGRVVPITDNQVSFSVSQGGRIIGTGNGDPTNQEPDKGTSRKAFGGLCMALVQSTSNAGEITVEATAPGLTSAKATIVAVKAVQRLQVPAWEREIPSGAGVTGLWRPAPTAGGSMAEEFLTGGGSMVFTLRQEGGKLSGSVEGGEISFFGGSDAPVPIVEGKVDGSSISFKAGNSTYTGSVKGDQIELARKIEFNMDWFPKPKTPVGPQPAIGPAPDGSDPSIGDSFNLPPAIPVVLKRAQR